MTRLARGRDTHLTPEEIATAALAQFDRGQEPSMRGLAATLGVAPSAIYHHFDSREAIVDAALGLVWSEAAEVGFRLLAEVEDPSPEDLLLAAALATRRAFASHHQLAPHIAATPAANAQLAANLGLLAGAFEGLGLDSEEAGRAFHAYGSYAVGSTLVLAARLNLGEVRPEEGAQGDGGAEPASDHQLALERMMDVSYADPERDEELFLDGLRRLIASFAPAGR